MNAKVIYAILIALGLLPTIISCSRFYKVNVPKSEKWNVNAEGLSKLDSSGRVFILRSGDRAFVMDVKTISEDQSTLEVILSSTDPFHMHHVMNSGTKRRKYKRTVPEQQTVINEVHLYIPPDSSLGEGYYVLNLKDVQKMEVLEKDKNRTTVSYIIGGTAIVVGSVAIVVAIVAALKSSCPFVSGYTEKGFALQGEIFSGAIFPQLERDDYLPLHLKPDKHGTVKVQISNELQEVQYTNLANLKVITHSMGSEIISDAGGNYYTADDPQQAQSANDGSGANIAGYLSGRNDLKFAQMADTANANGKSFVELVFNKPANITDGRLLLSIKNSYFLDLLYGELIKGFGNYYPQYVAQQKKKSRGELMHWLKSQHIPLHVEVESGEGWKEAGSINSVGPLAFRTIAVPIKFPEGKDQVRVRLSSGFMFWEIDYAAMDFTTQGNLEIEELKPLAARNEVGENVKKFVTDSDKLYLVQPEIGNRTILTFRHKIREGMKHTYVLHTRGYYEHKRSFSNTPDLNFVSRFSAPNSFPLFGKEVYYQRIAGKEALAAFISNNQ